jgi:hypothetical protein
MAKLTRGDIKTKFNDLSSGLYKDNTIGDITPLTVRTNVDDEADSTLFWEDVVDEDDMASDDATKPPSQQSVKAFVQTSVAAITAEQVGLGNVNNTSDTDKPISTATQSALDTLTSAVAAVPAAFVATATVWVDSAGNDGTGTVGRSDKPFATIAAALDATTGVTSLKLFIGMGTYAAPASAKLRSNVWIQGAGKPGYSGSITQTTTVLSLTIIDPTSLVGGTIIRGSMNFFDVRRVVLSDLGVDVGSSAVTAGFTEGNQIAFLSSSATGPWTLSDGIVIRNVTTLGRNASSAFHGIQLENAYRPMVENCDTYFSTHGIVLKTYGGIINNVRCSFHTSNGIIFKTDTYAFGCLSQISNFEIQGGGGIRLHIGSGASNASGGLVGMVSNGYIRSSSFGVLVVTSDSTSKVHYCQVSNVKVYSSTGRGFDITDGQSIQINNCMALACTDGFRIVSGGSNTFSAVMNSHSEGCTNGFVISATSSSALIRNCSGRLNTTHYTFTGNVTASGLSFDQGTTAFSGTPLNSGSASLNFDLTSVNSQDLTITATGAADGDPVVLGVPVASITANVVYTAFVSAVNTITVRASRIDVATGANPAAGTFTARALKNY